MSFKDSLRDKKERYESIVKSLMNLKNQIFEEGKKIEQDLEQMWN